MENEFFSVDIKKSDNGDIIHFINIENVDDKIERLIEEQIVDIWDGDNGSSIDIVKTEISTYLKTKSENIIKGSIAEFIIHLYLNSCGYIQECLFRNLEEGSIKKGFDGYYSYSNEEWIMESKSGSIKTEGISHKKKIKEAYNDLKDKIEGTNPENKNNPWSNAYNHAVLAKSSTDILKNIKNLSSNYVKKEFPDINKLNLIPSSTIFHEGEWDENILKPNHEEISKQNETFNYQKINVICVNKKSIDAIIKIITQ